MLCRPSARVVEQVTDGNFLIALIPVIQINGIIQDSLRSEDPVIQAKHTVLTEPHYRCCSDELRDRGNAEEMPRFHFLSRFCVCCSETLGVYQVFILCNGHTCTFNSPSLKKGFNTSVNNGRFVEIRVLVIDEHGKRYFLVIHHSGIGPVGKTHGNLTEKEDNEK